MEEINADDARDTSAAGAKGGRPYARLRTIVQYSFLLFVIYIGIRFGIFVNMVRSGSVDVSARPPSVEGFLPISALMSLLYLLKARVANSVHPAGLVIFTTIILLSLFIRRGFCGWICPVGTISEMAQKAGRRLMGDNLKMPAALDIPLLSLKYLLIGFFLLNILPTPAAELKSFIYAPYNKVADIKMYMFFEDLGRTAAIVIFTLVMLSVFIRHFWCRYLCPYGALLGLISLSSSAAVKRSEDKCIKCGKCEKACPNSIKVRRKKRVNTVECMACYSCIDACPVEGALEFESGPGAGKIRKEIYAAITALALLAITQFFSIIGYWQTSTTAEEYIELNKQIDAISHVR